MDLPAMKPNIRGPVHVLDNVLEQALCSVARGMVILLRTRRIGLRLTALADALVVLSAPYVRAGGRVFAAEILKAMRDSAYAASIAPSAEKVVSRLAIAVPLFRSPSSSGFRRACWTRLRDAA